eukprot:scaffold65960_cov22-Tisochrysis_lutea.AAC.1
MHLIQSGRAGSANPTLVFQPPIQHKSTCMQTVMIMDSFERVLIRQDYPQLAGYGEATQELYPYARDIPPGGNHDKCG